MDLVITGGTGGLGIAVVARYLELGWTVHLPMIEPALPAHLPWRDHARVRATANVTLTDEDAVTRFYANLAPNASVHLAGGYMGAPVADTRLADYEKMHALNAVTAFLCSREAVRAMRRAGAGGRIVNVISRAALSPSAGSIAYTASKAEVAAMTEALAAEVLADGILVNAIAPSVIDTPANRAAMPGADHARWPRPEEIAEVLSFLTSPANTLISGALLPVYGRG